VVDDLHENKVTGRRSVELQRVIDLQINSNIAKASRESTVTQHHILISE